MGENTKPYVNIIREDRSFSIHSDIDSEGFDYTQIF